MTPEKVFAFSRAYQLYYKGNFDFQKYGGRLPMPPLIQQKDRQFYHRIANRLDDAAVHALFTVSYFFQPKRYISELVSGDALKAATTFAARAQNGRPLFEAELYDLLRRFAREPLEGAPAMDDIVEWLYDNGMPGCIQDLMRGILPLDIACMLLLIPQKHLQYDWSSYWMQRPDAALGLGPQPWIDRLKKADQLIYAQRTGWRTLSHELAKEFWAGIGKTSLAPQEKTTSELFA